MLRTSKRCVATRGRPIAGFLLAALVVFGLAVQTAPAASAHAVLEESSPSADELLTVSPTAVSLLFSESVAVRADGIQVYAASGAAQRLGRFELSEGDRRITVPLKDTLAGTATVGWRVVSGDGHTISGSFVFHVGERTGAAVAIEQRSMVVVALGWLGRVLSLMSLILVGGAVSLLLMIGSSQIGTASAASTGLIRVGSVVGGLGALLVRATRVAEILGVSLISAFGRILDLSLGRTGWFDLIRVLLAAAIVATVYAGSRRDGPFAQQYLRVIAALWVLLALSWAASGHGWTARAAAVAIGADTIHLLGASLWVGVLLVGFWCLGRPVSDERNSGSDKSSANSGEAEVLPGEAEVLPGEAKVLRGEVEGLAVEGGSQDVVLLHQVSSLASIGLPALVVSGLVGTILHVDSVAAAGSTLYGRLLIAKVALAVAMAIVGFINQRQLAAAHIAGLNWLRQMQRRIGIELVMVSIVVGLTGVLVASTPARDAYRPVLVAEYTQGELKTELRITPARVGLNDIRIRFLASDGSRRDVNAVTIRVSSSTVPERKVPLTIVNGSEVRATGVSFGVPGTWKILISTLSETGSDSASFEVDL